MNEAAQMALKSTGVAGLPSRHAPPLRDLQMENLGMGTIHTVRGIAGEPLMHYVAQWCAQRLADVAVHWVIR